MSFACCLFTFYSVNISILLHNRVTSSQSTAGKMPYLLPLGREFAPLQRPADVQGAGRDGVAGLV